MRKLRYVVLAAACTCLAGVLSALALASSSAGGGHQHAKAASHVSGDVRKMVHEVSADRIENSINTLAGFGTRHTLSSQTDPNRGIGAATNWIYDQFQQYAAASNGRLTVEKQSFIQPPGPREPRPRDGHERDRDAARGAAGVGQPCLPG